MSHVNIEIFWDYEQFHVYPGFGDTKQRLVRTRFVVTGYGDFFIIRDCHTGVIMERQEVGVTCFTKQYEFGPTDKSYVFRTHDEAVIYAKQLEDSRQKYGVQVYPNLRRVVVEVYRPDTYYSGGVYADLAEAKRRSLIIATSNGRDWKAGKCVFGEVTSEEEEKREYAVIIDFNDNTVRLAKANGYLKMQSNETMHGIQIVIYHSYDEANSFAINTSIRNKYTLSIDDDIMKQTIKKEEKPVSRFGIQIYENMHMVVIEEYVPEVFYSGGVYHNYEDARRKAKVISISQDFSVQDKIRRYWKEEKPVQITMEDVVQMLMEKGIKIGDEFKAGTMCSTFRIRETNFQVYSIEYHTSGNPWRIVDIPASCFVSVDVRITKSAPWKPSQGDTYYVIGMSIDTGFVVENVLFTMTQRQCAEVDYLFRSNNLFRTKQEAQRKANELNDVMRKR